MPSSQAITSMSQLGEVLDAVRVKYRELKGEMSDASFKMLEAHVSRAKTALEELNDVAVLSKLRESIDKAVNIKAWYDLLHIPQTIQKGFSNIDDFDQTVEDQFRISIEGVPYASEWDIAFLKTLERIGIQEAKGEKMPVFGTRASRLMTLIIISIIIRVLFFRTRARMLPHLYVLYSNKGIFGLISHVHIL